MDTALILAGGQSIRFGTPKALVDVAGKPMVARVADAVASLVGEIVVSVAEARDADFLRPILPRAKFAVDRRR
ncbi:MAG: molybdenum cofactor guanylyltransferase, partial [Methanobacteriota archaeon]